MAVSKRDGDRALNRRQALKLAASGAVGGAVAAGLAGTAEAAEKGRIKDIKDSSGGSIIVDIAGAPNASQNISSVVVSDLNVDIRETTTGTDVEYRLYGPGDAHYGSAKVTSAVTLGSSKELQTWFLDTSRGQNIRKNITVTLFKSDKSAGRSYTLHQCFPTQWSAVNFDTSSTVQTETLTCKVGYIEFKV